MVIVALVIAISLPTLAPSAHAVPTPTSNDTFYDLSKFCNSMVSMQGTKSGSSSGVAEALYDDQTTSCNGETQYAVTGSTVAGTASDDTTVTMSVPSFTIPQSAGPIYNLAFSGDYFVIGYVSVNGGVGICCTYNANAEIIVSLDVNPGNHHWQLQDWNQNCSGIIQTSCGQYTTIDSTFQFSENVNLAPGTYTMTMTFEAKSSFSATGVSAGMAQACLNYVGGGACDAPPFSINNGNPPQTPSTICPSQITSPCYYAQWLDLTFPFVKADVNWDGAVNIIDLSTCSAAFGSTPGSSNWNGRCDINNDGAVNILDLSYIALWFGWQLT